jgi:transposase-like protein
MTRRHRSKEEVRELIEKFHASGLRRIEYCRQIGVGKSTLDRWIQKHNHHRRFIKVNLTQSATTDRGFALVLANGRRIEGGWQFGDADLARLIRIVETV